MVFYVGPLLTLSIADKKMLYLSLVRSQLMYCSPVVKLEKVQRRATKYIVNDYSLDYYSRLRALELLPLMYQLELNDILFCVNSLQCPSVSFDIRNFITFSDSNTRSSSKAKMVHLRSCNNKNRHYYFNRLPRLWNFLPSVDLSLPLNTIKKHLLSHLKDHFIASFNPSNICTYHYLCPCSKCSHSPTTPCF